MSNERMIPREALDAAIAAVKRYYSDEVPAGDQDAANAMLDACREAETACGVGLCKAADILVGILSYSGWKRDATNEDIYKVLEVLGWTVE